ncbi:MULTISPECIES: DUF559 domain-containing protein [unclassified Microbacterium]|uniref:DUF559 domain-containing protein n=1 Tax=unclassified Microbacterium TaxID=2609290 RepID=UPI003018A4FE
MQITLDAWVASVGEVAHTSSARAAGYSKHHIAAAVADRSVDRVRRSWLVTPTCGPDRRAAARAGGRLSCVSAAARMGLWVPELPVLPHISLPHSAARSTHVEATWHWATGPVPLPRTEPNEHPINVLFHIARCLQRAQALAVWESALKRGIVRSDVLDRVQWRCTAARELAAVAGSLSDSGIETAFVSLMRRAGVTVRQQVWVDGHPLDGVIGERLGVQVDGLAFHQASDRRRDLRADARLALRGYTILRFDYYQVLFDPAYVIDTVLTAIAQGLHLAPPHRR